MTDKGGIKRANERSYLPLHLWSYSRVETTVDWCCTVN